jgi:hypothetical protein
MESGVLYFRAPKAIALFQKEGRKAAFNWASGLKMKRILLKFGRFPVPLIKRDCRILQLNVYLSSVKR